MFRLSLIALKAKDMAKEALEGSTAHANCSINAVYNAPVIIVPDNMFSESAKYLKFNMGIP